MRLLSFVLLFSLVLTPLIAQKKAVSDDVINDQVRVKLASDSEIGGMSIQVDVQNGVVTLKGKVRNDKMRSKAEKVAKKVKGVTSVTNQIVVSPD
jgi:hyperosmotically inducible periplasmic protein